MVHIKDILPHEFKHTRKKDLTRHNKEKYMSALHESLQPIDYATDNEYNIYTIWTGALQHAIDILKEYTTISTTDKNPYIVYKIKGNGAPLP